MIRTRDSLEMYKQWNYTTACCFKHKCKCDRCPNVIVCSQITNPVGDYKIHPVKYATIKTYANIGLKGYKRAFTEKGGYRTEKWGVNDTSDE